jgi:hypothetical protein
MINGYLTKEEDREEEAGLQRGCDRSGVVDNTPNLFLALIIQQMTFLVLPCYSFLIAWENIKKILFFIL